MNKPVALITGAGRGIGRAVALEFAAHECNLALVARTESQLQETSNLCGAPSLVCPGDVADAAQIESIARRALEHFGRIDYFIHCAGVAPSSPIESMTDAAWESILSTNLSALFRFSRKLWPIFRKRRGGVIVNISSMAARDPFSGLGPYGASKAAANLLCQSMAKEGVADNIRVYSVAPGATETEMFRSLFTPEQFPPENAMTPQEVARVVVQCAVGDLRFTSGEVIYIRKTLG